MLRRSLLSSGWPEKAPRVLGAVCLGAVLTLPVTATDYSMQVRLDPSTRILQGSARIEWTNTSQVPVQSLCFHQYYNAWKDSNSSFLNSNRMSTRDFSAWRKDEWSYSKIEHLRIRGSRDERDRVADLQYRSREDGNAADRTVFELELEEVVAPGQAIQIEVEFEDRIPRTFARTGYRGDYFLIAQWFPKLGVLQADGTWNCRQFIQTEFFADFGTYDVKIEAPEGWRVGASGALLESKQLADGYVTHHFFQERIHDFAWAASPDFQVVEEDFEYPGLQPVQLRLLLMPDHAGQAERYLKAVRAGLQYDGTWFGEYPYGHLTIVDPAYQSRTGGMEYPTLFTAGTSWWNPAGSGQPESVTIHEFGHQIWYGVVANNEFEDAWLDEGLNSYSTTRVLGEVYGRPLLTRRYLDGILAYSFPDMTREWRSLVGTGTFYSELKWDRMDTPSWQYGPASSRYSTSPPSSDRVYGPGAYSINSYDKPALMLKTLEGYLGWEVMRRILATFFERYRFRHPTAEDFIEVSQEVAGQDLSWFWQQTYHSSEVCDYAVDLVQNDDPRQRIVIRRWGEVVLPIEIEVVFENGVRLLEHWDGKERWKAFDYVVEGNPIVQVRVDPEGKLALDVNPLNDSWALHDDSRFAGRKWGLKWMLWLQQLLQQFAS